MSTSTTSAMPRFPLAGRAYVQGEMLDHLRERSLAVDARAKAATAGLTEEELARPRRGGGWGVGQLLEHLSIAAGDYLDALEPRLGRTGNAAATTVTWRASVIGRILMKSLDERARRRLPAPRRWRVAEQAVLPDALARFLATQERLRSAIERARSHALTRVRVGSPVLPLLRMNAGDALVVIVVHSERHMAQLERAAGELRAGSAPTT